MLYINLLLYNFFVSKARINFKRPVNGSYVEVRIEESIINLNDIRFDFEAWFIHELSFRLECRTLLD